MNENRAYRGRPLCLLAREKKLCVALEGEILYHGARGKIERNVLALGISSIL